MPNIDNTNIDIQDNSTIKAQISHTTFGISDIDKSKTNGDFTIKQSAMSEIGRHTILATQIVLKKQFKNNRI